MVQPTYLRFLKPLFLLILFQVTGVEGKGCKNVLWLQKKDGSYLRNHIIQTLTTETQSMCRVMCYLSDSCLSYNFHKSTGTCDINDSDGSQHPGDLIQSEGFVHVGTENGCQSSPCPNSSIGCQADFTYKGGYKCLCPTGYTGPACNADVDECATGTHNCSAYMKCQNTRGSFYCIPPGIPENPAKSCLIIKKSGYSNGSDVYWLDPANTGTPIPALCDMTTDGGGWTVVKRLVVQPINAPLPNLVANTYEVIKEYNRTDVNILPKGPAMLDIHQKMGFHQIHFYCRKESVGRIVSIMTKNNTAGHAVVNYFISLVAITPPAACGSFDRLPEDTSVLGQNCNKWGGKAGGLPAEVETNQWGGACCTGAGRLTARAFQIVSTPSHGFESQIYYLCDNEVLTDSTLKVAPDVNDIWQISVR